MTLSNVLVVIVIIGTLSVTVLRTIRLKALRLLVRSSVLVSVTSCVIRGVG